MDVITLSKARKYTDKSVATGGNPELIEDLITKEVAKIKPPKGEDGKNPVKGVDYFTESDKNEIISELLKQLPDGSEVAY